jgi:hypothetical protein
MDIRSHCAVLALAASATILAPTARGQDSLRVLARSADTTYLVVVGRDTLIAMTKARAHRASVAAFERDSLRGMVELLDLYRKRRVLADSALASCKDYALQADSLYRGYKALAEGYRSLSRGAWLTFDAGLGGSGADKRPAVLLGLGVRRIRLWGFFQERNSGGFVGASLRLF